MDIVIVFIIMAILYIIPELFRGKRPKEYKYPEIPEAPEIPRIPEAPPVKLEKASHSHNKMVTAAGKPVVSSDSILTLSEKENNTLPVPIPSQIYGVNESSVPSTGFTHAELLNGIIWAEVLLPPRAHRPLSFKVIQKTDRS